MQVDLRRPAMHWDLLQSQKERCIGTYFNRKRSSQVLDKIGVLPWDLRKNTIQSHLSVRYGSKSSKT